MPHDPRDTIWDKASETYYDAMFYEKVADKLVGRWLITDDISKVLVAATASGSAISGWALWQTPEFKLIWLTFAGIGALLSIIHATLGVPGRLKDWEEAKRAFVTLRVNLETFRHGMEINPEFSISEYTDKYIQLRAQFGELVPRQKNDILLTKRLRIKAQDEVDAALVIHTTDKKHSE